MSAVFVLTLLERVLTDDVLAFVAMFDVFVLTLLDSVLNDVDDGKSLADALDVSVAADTMLSCRCEFVITSDES